MFAYLFRWRLRLFCAENLNPIVPPFKQTYKQNRTKFEFEKHKQFLENCIDLKEFTGFSNLERNLDVISEKLCLLTKMSRFWSAVFIVDSQYLTKGWENTVKRFQYFMSLEYRKSHDTTRIGENINPPESMRRTSTISKLDQNSWKGRSLDWYFRNGSNSKS